MNEQNLGNIQSSQNFTNQNSPNFNQSQNFKNLSKNSKIDENSPKFAGISSISLALLEKERQRVNAKIAKLKLFCLIVFGLFTVWLILNSKSDRIGDCISFILIGAFAFYNWRKNVITRSIRSKFKAEVVSKIIKDINPHFVYIPHMHISENEFSKAGVFELNGGTFDGNDLISGKIDGVKFKMSDVSYTEIRREGRNTKQVTIFKGIVFIADFYKNFTSHTIVANSDYAKPVGKRIKIDNMDFNNRFKIYTNDEINAFYLLSPNFMERFLWLSNNVSYYIDAAFVGNKIYIFIDNKEDNFEINLDTKLTDISTIYATYKFSLEVFFNIIKDLKLNLEIFKTKAENG